MVQEQQHSSKGYRLAYHYDGLTRRPRMGVRDGEQHSHRSILGTIAEQERATIKSRQAEGINTAKAKGVKFGRPALQFPANWNEVYTQWKNGEITAKVAMEKTGTKRTSFYKLVKLFQNNQ